MFVQVPGSSLRRSEKCRWSRVNGDNEGLRFIRRQPSEKVGPSLRPGQFPLGQLGTIAVVKPSPQGLGWPLIPPALERKQVRSASAVFPYIGTAD
jgi:hypothetical protein